MKLLRQIWRELVKLFVDDGAMALQILLKVALIVALVKVMGLPALWGAVLLLPGCALILMSSLIRARKK